MKTKVSGDNLKSCRFCGCEDVVFLEKSSFLPNKERRKNRAIRVQCSCCKSSTGDFALYQMAQNQWNERYQL